MIDRRRLWEKLGAAFAMLLWAGPLSADTLLWHEFEARCLEPMSRFELAHPTDLPHLRSYKNDGNTYEVYGLPSANAELEITNRIGRTGAPAWTGVFCGVASREQGSETANAVLAWSSTEDGHAMWEDVSDGRPSLVLRSTTWREPKMEVWMTLSDTGIRLRAVETNLES